jgi:predicted Rossmann fold nucleotide-binding protein DprA/Smf involved in DNA uptake
MTGWRDLWPYARTWWGTTVGVITVLWILFHTPRVALEDWDWYLGRRYDSKTKDAMENHKRQSPTAGAQSMTVANISQETGMSEKRVTKSLLRLRKKNVVRQHGDNWLLL